MDFPLTFTDLQHFVAIKFIFFGFIIFGLLGIYRKWGAVYFVSLGALSCAASYLILVDNLELMFWGLKADEITIAAMYEQFAHGSFWSDFNYARLPPFYPSLFFQIVAVLGRWFNWNGVQIAKLGTSATMFLFPIALFYLQTYWWKNKNNENKPGVLAWLLAVLFIFLLPGWDAIITKPYELVSAAGVVLWSTMLMMDVFEDRLSTKKIVMYGIAGGILFWLFYFWFFLAAIGIALFNVWSGKRVTPLQYGKLAIIGLITLVVASPFWIPLARIYSLQGAENWQFGFFTIEWIANHVPGIVFSVHGIISLFGLIVLVAYRRILYIRALLSLMVAGLIWQAMGLATIFFFASPLQESKGFLFFSTAVFALAVAYGIEKVWNNCREKISISPTTASSILLLIAAPQLFFGTFADAEEVQEVRIRARALKPELREVATFLQSQNTQDATILTSGIPELHAFVPFTEFIYFNQHNSHPAALFSQRHAFVRQLSDISSSTIFYDTMHEREEGIDMIILYKGGERSEYYPLYFNLDNFPHRIQEETIYIAKKMFDPKYFKVVFENEAYIAYKPK